MKMKRCYKGLIFLTVLVMGIAGMMVFASAKTEAAVNIVLDAGHDDTHVGARANGVEEEDLNLKIATYCYKELATYANVNLHMVRTGEACPFAAESNVICNQKRVDFAKSVGASAYVSFHNNAAPNASARGATVYYPNMSFRSDIGTAGQRLAQMVQSRLVALGLQDRGIAIRNSEDNTRYPDSSLADYYAVIKYSKLAGFPGIIIEHAFMTNVSDVEGYLNTDEKLQLLGIADAKAIAEYFGLVKHWSNFAKNAQLQSVRSDDGKTATVTLKGVLNAPQVYFAVWTEENGQDDLIWYEAKEVAKDSWSTNIAVANHNYDENYIVHAYILENGKSTFIKDMNYKLERTQTETKVKKVAYETGIEVSVSNLPYADDIESVRFVFQKEASDETAKTIYSMKPQQGSYKTTVYYSNHPENCTYTGTILAVMKNGVVLTLDTVEVTPDGEDKIVTSEAVDVSGADILLEKTYYPTQNTKAYRTVKTLIPKEENMLQQGFYIYGQQLLENGTVVNVQGDYDITLPVPEGYASEDIIVYGLEVSGDSVTLTDRKVVDINENGDYVVREDSLGLYVICFNSRVETFGDVNFDGNITLVDANLVLRYALGIRTYTQEELYVADVDFSGTLDLSDANRTLRAALGIN